ncbi:hypothetical protein [Peredibacter starrii]|uniref:Uncharacterized protein n=1 Tax=Peredibacter starrii TaxID=28202 RepID=A0AAX4HNW3_9BACT|nr:hypothetical protein [Peredibacter starrii]WPU64880.1 hypothetical protein SOO65_19480 [Peredibacter starrii]
MKWIFVFLLVSSSAFAKCDLAPLKDEIISKYKDPMPVTNEKGEVGHALAKNFKISDYLMRLPTEYVLTANFELDIKWETGLTQSVRTLVVGSVNPRTCKIDKFNNEQVAAK